MKNQEQKTTLHQVYKTASKSRDIADDIFDWVNCFEVEELETFANKNNIADDYNNVMLWLADNIEVAETNSDYIICKISQFIDQHRGLFDKFLNEVYKEEYQPRNNEPIESESEEFYDYYLEGFFGGLINGSFSTEDYTTLWRLICEDRADKTTLKTECEKMGKMSQELDALHYARYLVDKKHNEALDMVQNVPNNVYIEDWKKTEKDLAKKSDLLAQLENDLQKELHDLCDAIEQERNEQRKILDNYFNSNLKSAYQENAIMNAVYDVYDGDIYKAQQFADACCDYYREQLKQAGYGEDTGKNSVYNGFAKFGDECQVQSVAFVVYGIITR